MSFERYYFKPNEPNTLGSVTQLWRQFKGLVSRKEIKEWLNKQNAYTLHKPVRRKFKRRKVKIGGVCQQFEIDLIDVINLRQKPFKYIVTVIDVFTKQLWAEPVKNKTGHEIVRAFDKILKRSRFGLPLYLSADKGKEFYNSQFQNYLKKKGITLFSTENSDIKGSIIERVNLTLKKRLYRYFTRVGSTKFVKVLPLIVEGYNNSYHSSIGMAPIDVNGNNAEKVWQRLYGKRDKKQKPLFKVGDQVRLSKNKKTFKKSYLPNWTEEIFIIKEVLNTNPTTYRITDMSGEEIKGSFYEPEMQYVEGDIYHIEKILRTKKYKNQKQYFVKWSGYSDKYNSWVKENELVNLS